jgi:hypothetical protein
VCAVTVDCGWLWADASKRWVCPGRYARRVLQSSGDWLFVLLSLPTLCASSEPAMSALVPSVCSADWRWTRLMFLCVRLCSCCALLCMLAWSDSVSVQTHLALAMWGCADGCGFEGGVVLVSWTGRMGVGAWFCCVCLHDRGNVRAALASVRCAYAENCARALNPVGSAGDSHPLCLPVQDSGSALSLFVCFLCALACVRCAVH